jgi:broad specificity phosphatase PhoE
MSLLFPAIGESVSKRQLIGVVRHSERADATWCAKDSWYHAENNLGCSVDPPLSDHGLEEAEAIGHVVHDWVREREDYMCNIISSPYLRCVQTAVKICKELGSTSRIIIDYSLGEVRSPDILGAAGKEETTRPLQDILSYCKLHGVYCSDATIGTMPAWPESLRSAKKRFARCFLEHLHSEQNFICVSHAECVQATLTLMPSRVERGHTVLNVDFGGFFLASRETQKDSPNDDGVYQDYHDDDVLNHDIISTRQETCESTLSARCEFEDNDDSPSARCKFEEDVDSNSSTNLSETSSRSWTIWLYNIKCMKTSKKRSERRRKTLVQTGLYDREQLTHLLGESSSRGNLQRLLDQLPDAQLVKLGSTPLGSEDNIKKPGRIASNSVLGSMSPLAESGPGQRSVLGAWAHSALSAISKSGYDFEQPFAQFESWPAVSSSSQQEDHAQNMKQHLELRHEANSLTPMVPTSRQPEHQAQQMHHDVVPSALIKKREVVLDTNPNCKLLERRRQKMSATYSTV